MSVRRRAARAVVDLEFAKDTLIPRIEKNLRWASTLRYHRLRIQETEKVKVSGTSDPTGEVATGRAQERVKAAKRSAERHIEEAIQALEAADKELDTAFRQADPTYVPTDQRLHPPLVSDEELREARAAQRRREDRGGGFGES